MARDTHRRIPPLLLTILALLALPVPGASANGTPVTIVLSYLEGVSTWGPTAATGVAELVTKESEVRVTATGLPRLDGDEYHVWIVNTGTSQRMDLGAFNAAGNGRASLDVVLDREIPDLGWNLLLISVEPAGSTPNEPGPRRSIAGRFPLPVSGQGRPALLPQTGGSVAEGTASSQVPILAAGLLVQLAAVAGLALWLSRHPIPGGAR